MRRRTLWLAWLLTAGMALAPAQVRSQEVPPADPVFPAPLYHSHPDSGGLFLATEFALFRQRNPLRNQTIAVRGFLDEDGSITGRAGTFVGSGNEALNAKDAGGPGTYQPGFIVTGGWRFVDGSAIEVNWMHLFSAQFSAVATLAAPGLQLGPAQADSFLFAPVFNFPNDFAGPIADAAGRPAKVNAGLPGATFGIWNAASIMSIQFTQRFDQIEATYRVPIFETEYWRCYGLVGPRFSWIWERFKWRTVDLTLAGASSPVDVAIYTNIVSNRMYGAHLGAGNEWYLGHGFAVSLDLEGALFLDVVRERAKYELGAKDTGAQGKRSRVDFAVVPEVQAGLNLWWYPIEGVQVRLGYDLMAFFNTVAGRQPVSFNFGGLDPPWERTTRWFDGVQVGIGLIF